MLAMIKEINSQVKIMQNKQAAKNYEVEEAIKNLKIN